MVQGLQQLRRIRAATTPKLRCKRPYLFDRKRAIVRCYYDMTCRSGAVSCTIFREATMNRRRFLGAAGAVFFSEGLPSQSLQAIAPKVVSATAPVAADYSSRHIALSVIPWAEDEYSIAEVAAVEVLRHGLSGQCCWADVSRGIGHSEATVFFATLLDVIGESPLIVSDHARTFECLRRSLQKAGFPSRFFVDNMHTDIGKCVTGQELNVVELASSMSTPCTGVNEEGFRGNVALLYAENDGNLFVAARQLGMIEVG